MSWKVSKNQSKLQIRVLKKGLYKFFKMPIGVEITWTPQMDDDLLYIRGVERGRKQMQVWWLRVSQERHAYIGPWAGWAWYVHADCPVSHVRSGSSSECLIMYIHLHMQRNSFSFKQVLRLELFLEKDVFLSPTLLIITMRFGHALIRHRGVDPWIKWSKLFLTLFFF